MRAAIDKWMRANVVRFVDSCGEVNATTMVEIWDFECSTGSATLDADHMAWSVAVEIAVEHEDRSGKAPAYVARLRQGKKG